MSPEERLVAILCHVSMFFAPILLPLIIFLLQPFKSGSLKSHAKESLNFQITMLIVFAICGFFSHIQIMYLIIGIMSILQLIWIILASFKAFKGSFYYYPLNLRIV